MYIYMQFVFNLKTLLWSIWLSKVEQIWRQNFVERLFNMGEPAFSVLLKKILKYYLNIYIFINIHKILITHLRRSKPRGYEYFDIFFNNKDSKWVTGREFAIQNSKPWKKI